MIQHLQTTKPFPNQRPSATAREEQVFYEAHGGAGPTLFFWLSNKLMHRGRQATKEKGPANDGRAFPNFIKREA